MPEFVEVNGITNVTYDNGDIKTTIHVNDFLAAIAKLPTKKNGTIVVVARKRLSLSNLGHTHYKPGIQMRTECDQSAQ